MKSNSISVQWGVSAAFAAFVLQSAAFAADVIPFSQQWALNNTGQKACDLSGKCQDGIAGKDIKALAAWEINHDCRNVIVAVLDSGVDFNHPDLKANLLPGKNFTTASPTDDATDDNLHGTHVTGTIAAAGNARAGAAGICATAKVLPVKVATAEGALTDSDIIEGVTYAVKQGARVLNASFGGGAKSTVMEKTVNDAKNTLFVIAAGNGNPWTGVGFDIDRKPVYPASYNAPNIVAVAATDNRDTLGSFSNFGVKTVSIAAPGVGIMSTVPVVPTAEMTRYKIPTKYTWLDGTSMAAPHVAGAAALLLATNPSMTTAELKARLLASVEKVPALTGKVATGGRLNLLSLLKQASFRR